MTSRTLLAGGCVLTLGQRTQNRSRADVLLDEGVVAEIGVGLRARDAERIDVSDTIVMPGFVDSHRHAWTSLFRNLGEAVTPDGASWEAALDHLGPQDVYAATLVGLLGAAEAGVTTVVDWAPLGVGDGTAEAALRAHADAGLRTVFVHAPSDRDRPAGPSREHLDRLIAAAGPSTDVALGADLPGSRGPGSAVDAWELARAMGLRVHAHGGSERSAPGAIADAARRGLLGADVTLVHPSELDDADVEAIAASGTAVTLAPSSEMASGGAWPPIQRLMDRDVRPGLAVGDERVTPGDLFAQMRETISLQHATVFDRKLAGKAGLPKLMTTRDVIRLATVDGARAAGLAGVTGSLEPGMRADVIVLRTDRPNVFPINDPIGAVVWGMDTSNLDRVFVGGRAVMRDGALLADVERARRLAIAARDRVVAASGPLAAGAGRAAS